MTPLTSLEHELTTHAGALRALARALAGGRENADDLVQETALRALSSPPPRAVGLGAWLGTVLRHCAHTQRRAERRRARRERAAARPEAVSPHAGTEHRETLRAVTAAVLALPEPYQSALLLRYYEDLSPTQIAARLHIPVATVKSRLQRGLAKLRADLARRDPAWRAMLGAALGIAAPAEPALLSTGVLLMAPTAKLALAATAAAALLGAALLLTNSAPPPAPTLEAGADEQAAHPAAQGVPARTPAEAREALPDAVGPPLDLAHPFAFELRCAVVDRDGLPLGGAQVLVALPGGALNAWPEPTDGDGRVVLQWRGRRAATTIALAVAGTGDDLSLRALEVQAGAPRAVALLGVRSPHTAFEKLYAAALVPKIDAARARQTPCADGQRGMDCSSCHSEPAPHTFAARVEPVRGLHPERTFADLLRGGAPPPPPLEIELPEMVTEPSSSDETEEISERTLLDETRRARLERLRNGSAPRATAEPPGALAGTVFGPDGKPHANVTVTWGAGATPAQRTRSRTGGGYAFEGIPPGAVTVRCGGGDDGLAVARAAVAAGATARADLLMARGRTMRGRALGADGAPLAGARVEYASDEPWADACTVRDDGTFVLANLPPGPGRLLLWPPRGALPVAVEPSVLPDSGELVFDLRAHGPLHGALQLAVRVPDGAPQNAPEIRVWHADSGRGALARTTPEGAFALRGLAAGFYRVEVRRPAYGCVDLGAHWVDGAGTTDLGVVDLPRPARVTLEAAHELASAPELYLRQRDGDVRALPPLGLGRNEVLLPPGDWLALWRAPGGALGATAFATRAGEECLLRLGGAPAAEAR